MSRLSYGLSFITRMLPSKRTEAEAAARHNIEFLHAAMQAPRPLLEQVLKG